MCPEVADETNPGKKASPTGSAEVGRCCAFGADCSALACSTFLLSLEDLRSSAVWARLTIELHQEGLSGARNSQDLVLMFTA